MKGKIAKILIIVILAFFSITFCSCEQPVTEMEGMFYLTFFDNFKVMQLADIQVADKYCCDVAFAEIDKMVEEEKPNLIILTGDNIDMYSEEGTFEALVEHMESYSIPWAPVYGNHDDEQDEELGISKEYMARAFEQAEHCLFHRGPDEIHGVGNYVINLVTENRTKIVYSFILLDSNAYRSYGYRVGYDYLYPDQVDWYEQTVKSLATQNKGVNVPAFAYFHIPLMEFETAKDVQLADNSLGWGELREEMGAPEENTGMFAKMKELGNTKAVICGHAHINNCNLLYEGISLICGLKSSRFSYYDEDMLGCTVLTLSSESFTVSNVSFVS